MVNCLVLGSLLVGGGRSIVLVLVALVLEGVNAGLGTSSKAGVVVLGDLLVGLLGSTRGGALDGLGDVVGGVLDGVHVD